MKRRNRVRILPRLPSEEAIAETYDGIVDKYYAHKMSVTDFDLVVWPYLRTALNDRVNGARILDIGTGTGLVPHEIFNIRGSEPKSILGIDISGQMIKKARSLFTDPRVSFEVASVTNMKGVVETDSIDLATAVHVFGHVVELQKALLEVRRVLCKPGKNNPGGRFILLGSHEQRNDQYYRESGFGSSAKNDTWVAERWPGSGGKYIPTRYLDTAAWTREFYRAGLLIEEIFTPWPVVRDPDALEETDSTYDIYSRYKKGVHRTIIFELIPKMNYNGSEANQ